MSVGRKLAFLVVGFLVSAATACSDDTVTAPERAAPGIPSYDGGGWTGSGSRIEQQDSSTITSDFNGTSGTVVGRGGGWTGSGS
jgi:hypothetical protein